MSEQMIQDRLASHPLFDGLKLQGMSSLAAAREISFAAWDVIYESGTQAKQAFLLVEGGLQIEYPPPHATRGPVVAMMRAPGVLGECQLLAKEPWSGTGVSVSDATLIAFTRDQWLALLDESPALSKRLYLELAGRFLRAIDSWRSTQSLAPEGVVARYLLGVAAIVTADHEACAPLPLTQQRVAQGVGLRRETVNRILKQWRAEEWIDIGRERILILAPDQLEALCGEDWKTFFKTYWALA